MADFIVSSKSQSEGEEPRWRVSNICYDDVIFDDHEIDNYRACMAFKVIIFEQFRHALTRHDPKTYLAWFVELILLQLKE